MPRRIFIRTALLLALTGLLSGGGAAVMTKNPESIPIHGMAVVTLIAGAGVSAGWRGAAEAP